MCCFYRLWSVYCWVTLFLRLWWQMTGADSILCPGNNTSTQVRVASRCLVCVYRIISRLFALFPQSVAFEFLVEGLDPALFRTVWRQNIPWYTVFKNAAVATGYDLACMYGGWDVHDLHVFMVFRVACQNHDSVKVLASRLGTNISNAFPCKESVSVTVSQLHTLSARLFCLGIIAGFRARKSLQAIDEGDVVPGLSFKGLMRYFFSAHVGWVEHEKVASRRQARGDGLDGSARMEWREEAGADRAFGVVCLGMLSVQITNLNASLRVPFPAANSSSRMWVVKFKMSGVSHSSFRRCLVGSGFVDTVLWASLEQLSANTYGLTLMMPLNMSSSEVSKFLVNTFKSYVRGKQIKIYGLFPVFPVMYNFFTAWSAASVVKPSHASLDSDPDLDLFLAIGGAFDSMSRQEVPANLVGRVSEVVAMPVSRDRRSRLFPDLRCLDQYSLYTLITMIIMKAAWHPGFHMREIAALGTYAIQNKNIPPNLLPTRPLLYMGFEHTRAASAKENRKNIGGKDKAAAREMGISTWLGAWADPAQEEGASCNTHARMSAGAGGGGLHDLSRKSRLDSDAQSRDASIEVGRLLNSYPIPVVIVDRSSITLGEYTGVMDRPSPTVVSVEPVAMDTEPSPALSPIISSAVYTDPAAEPVPPPPAIATAFEIDPPSVICANKTEQSDEPVLSPLLVVPVAIKSRPSAEPMPPSLPVVPVKVKIEPADDGVEDVPAPGNSEVNTKSSAEPVPPSLPVVPVKVKIEPVDEGVEDVPAAGNNEVNTKFSAEPVPPSRPVVPVKVKIEPADEGVEDVPAPGNSEVSTESFAEPAPPPPPSAEPAPPSHPSAELAPPLPPAFVRRLPSFADVVNAEPPSDRSMLLLPPIAFTANVQPSPRTVAPSLPVSDGSAPGFGVLGIEKISFAQFNGKSAKEREEYLTSAFAVETSLEDEANVEGIKAFAQSFTFKQLMYDVMHSRRSAKKNMIQFDDYPPSTEEERKKAARTRIAGVAVAETIRMLNEDVSVLLRNNIGHRSAGSRRKYDEMEERCTKMLALIKKARTLEKDV